MDSKALLQYFKKQSTGGVLCGRMVFLKVLQNSQENNCAGFPFLPKLQDFRPRSKERDSQDLI